MNVIKKQNKKIPISGGLIDARSEQDIDTSRYIRDESQTYVELATINTPAVFKLTARSPCLQANTRRTESNLDPPSAGLEKSGKDPPDGIFRHMNGKDPPDSIFRYTDGKDPPGYSKVELGLPYMICNIFNIKKLFLEVCSGIKI